MHNRAAKHDLPIYTVHMIGLGKDKPLGDNNREARAKKRSVELKVVQRRSDHCFNQWRNGVTILVSTARSRGYGAARQRSCVSRCKLSCWLRYGWGRKLVLVSHGTKGFGHYFIAARLRGFRCHTPRLRTMRDLVKVGRSKKVLNPAWIDRLMLTWATSAGESWRRLLEALHGLAGETRGSIQLRETPDVCKGRASVLTPTDLLDELGRVARFTVRRALLIVQAFSRQSAVGVRVLPVDMSDKYWLVAQAAAVVLTPTAVMALVLSMWRIAADLHWTSSFVILTGLFQAGKCGWAWQRY